MLNIRRTTVPGVTLRPTQTDDEAFLYRVYAGTRADEMALLDWSEAETEDFLRMQFKAQHTFYHDQFGGALFDVVALEGEPVGRLYVDRRESEIRVIDIALLPEFRNRGIGGALMRDLLDEGAETGKPVTIHVEASNPAMGLYQRLGFVHVADESVYRLMEWRPPANGEG